MSQNRRKTEKDVARVKKFTVILVSLLYELEEKYALVQPMIFDKELPSAFNNQGYAAKGFDFLRTTLYLDCIKDSSRLYHDTYSSSPSVKKVLDLLSNRLVHQSIKLEFSTWKKKLSEEAGVSFISDGKEIKLFENKFDSLYKRIKKVSKELDKSNLLRKVKKARNKVIAHADVRELKGEYLRVSIADVGIKWGDVEQFIRTTRGLIFDLALLVNNTSYADHSYKNVHQKSSDDFWSVTTNKSKRSNSASAAVV